MQADERELQIEEVVQPVLRDRGLTLVDLEWRAHRPRGILRVYVDKPGGVGIQDCQSFSREAGDVLDVSGLIEPSYDLEVSSPGLDRVLRKDRELRWAIGREVRCWVGEPLDGQTEFAGRLLEVSPAALMLEEEVGTRREVPRRLVTKARLQLQAFGRTK